MRGILLLLGLLVVESLTAQTVRIFIHNSSFNGYPDATAINTDYGTAGFTTVNVTTGTIDATVTVSNYDVVYVTEFYNYSTNQPVFITSAQRQIVEDFLRDGGHVVWIAESIDSYISSAATPPVNSNAITTINAVYGTSLTYGTYYNNGGMGPPNLRRIHPSAGPGGLSVDASPTASGSYATLLNVPNANKVYSSESFDNTNSFDLCTHTTVALFPERPVATAGSIIISTELGVPFHGTPSGPFGGGPPVFNTVMDAAIATLHFRLVTNGNLTAINNWSSNTSNTNPNCRPLVVLPIDNLLEFDVNLMESRAVLLDWRIEPTAEVLHFLVERSKDGLHWESIATVMPNPTHRYAHIDYHPFIGDSYYRLHWVDYDGTSTYSAVKTVNLPRITDKAVVLYPNPSSNWVTIEHEGLDFRQCTLYDALGRQMPLLWTNKTPFKVELNVSDLAKGLYYLKTNFGTYKIYKH